MVSSTIACDDIYIATASISAKKPTSGRHEDSGFVYEEEPALENRPKKFPSFAGTILEEDEIDRKGDELDGVPAVIAGRMVSKLCTDEYLVITRQGTIVSILNTFDFMLRSLDDDVSLKMAKTLFKNEINSYYQNFISNAQDQYFLAIISLYEDLFSKDTIEKKVIKECCSQLRGLVKKAEITTADYKSISKRFFELGISTIGVKEEPTGD